MSRNSNTVIVTGGCGYIGSQTAKELKLDGYNVVIIDRVKRDHTLQYSDSFILGDYSDNDILHSIISYNPCAIVHCAGTSLVGPSVKDPGEYYENNVAKTIKMLNYLRVQLPQDIPAIIFSSSASVYGNPTTMPITEQFLMQPVSPYGKTKAMIEDILEDFNLAYGLQYVALRYFNACGADLDGELGQEKDATHIIARVLESQMNNQVFTLYGNDYKTADGTCVRDYIHVQDLADAHVKAIEYLLNRKGTSRSMNLGTNRGISNQQIIDYVKFHIGPVTVENGARRAGDPDTLIADPSYANQYLRWRPHHSDLSTIVNSAHNWYNKCKQVDIVT